MSNESREPQTETADLPSSTNPPASANPKIRKDEARLFARFNPLNLTLAGLPEMSYFESDEQRAAALRQIAKDAGRPNQWSYWTAAVLLWLVSMSIYFLGRYVMRFVQWPMMVEKSVIFIAVLLAAVLLIRRFHRQGMQSMLRSELLAQGVPVCMSCGYLLRGLPLDPGRCPECGKAFDLRVKEILNGVSGTRM